MKKALLICSFLWLGLMAAFAQAPSSMLSYQSVVRDAQNQLVVNQSDITVEVTVWNTDGTTQQYTETHSGLSTNENGLLTLMMGSSATHTGTWADIDWADASIQTVVRYESVEITSERAPVTAVPFALKAENVPDMSDFVPKTGDNAFTGTNIVPSGFDIHSTNSTNCGDVMVNACDLYNVLDSLSNRINSVYDSIARFSNELASLQDMIPTSFPCTATSQNGHLANTAGSGNGSDGKETADANGSILAVKDYDGNEYPVVEIGTQCWMAMNLRTTRYADGTIVPVGTTSNSSTTAPYYYNLNPTSPTIPLVQRGYLYNWPAAMKSTTTEGTQGVCPTGWHVPTDAEWSAMELVVNGSDVSGATGYRGSHAGKLSTSYYWTNSITVNAPGNYDNAERNSSGFSAVPAGYFYDSSFNDAGNSVGFWSSSVNGSDSWYRYLRYPQAGVCRDNNLRGNCGFSVRCVRD